MWYEKYLGIPFVHNGCSFEGVDCGGLGILVWREEGIADIPRQSYEEVFTREGKHEALSRYLSSLNKVDIPQPKDGFFAFNQSGQFGHCGIYVGNGRIIHAVYGEQVRLGNLNEFKRVQFFRGTKTP